PPQQPHPPSVPQQPRPRHPNSIAADISCVDRWYLYTTCLKTAGCREGVELLLKRHSVSKCLSYRVVPAIPSPTPGGCPPPPTPPSLSGYRWDQPTAAIDNIDESGTTRVYPTVSPHTALASMTAEALRDGLAGRLESYTHRWNRASARTPRPRPAWLHTQVGSFNPAAITGSVA